MAQLGQEEYVIFTSDNTGNYYLTVSTNDKVVVVPESTLAGSGTPMHIWYKETANDAARGSSSNLQQPSFVLVNKAKQDSALVVKNIQPRNGPLQVVLVLGSPGEDGERWTMAPAGGDLCYIQKATDPKLVFDAVNPKAASSSSSCRRSATVVPATLSHPSAG